LTKNLYGLYNSMSTKFDIYIPVILTALVVLVLGAWNPSAIQVKRGGKPSGYPSYLWLALIGLAIGLIAMWWMLKRKE